MLFCYNVINYGEIMDKEGEYANISGKQKDSRESSLPKGSVSIQSLCPDTKEEKKYLTTQ